MSTDSKIDLCLLLTGWVLLFAGTWVCLGSGAALSLCGLSMMGLALLKRPA
jgi:hypothetical protein